ncbi:MAG: hypothetical protein Q9187_008050 [Circinaria calcarea]
MSARSTHYRFSIARASPDSLKALSSKKHKTNGFRGTIRKLFGRKSVKSQISLPTPTIYLGHDSTTFITSATDYKDQRAVSLPALEISRTSALGSHCPLAASPRKVPEESNGDPVTKTPSRPRRATLPSLIVDIQDRETLHSVLGQEQPEGISHDANNEPIGFAVTSGSNPKRRSKSADQLYDIAKSHRMSPIQWRRWRRRSDEIASWRDSIEHGPAHDATLGPAAVQPNHDQKHLNTLDEDTQVLDGQLSSNDPNTFDFGILANTIHDQEHIPLEERVVTVEIKLIDLEYAISRLQARTPTPVEGDLRNRRPNMRPKEQCAEYVHSTPELGPCPCESSASSTIESRNMDDSIIAGSHSTQLTLPSLLGEPPSDEKLRPTSTATTVRPQTVIEMPVSPVREDDSETANRCSLTSVISLLRREQSARMRLEDIVSDLQLQLNDIKSSSSQSPYHRLLHENLRTQGSNEFLAFQGVRTGSDADETDTEDGFLDVYETPSEHKEFERPSFASLLEGKAF